MVNIIMSFLVGVLLGALAMYFVLSDGYKKVGGK